MFYSRAYTLKQHETYDVKYLSLAEKEKLRTHPSDGIAPCKAREKIVEAEEADQRSAQRRTCFTWSIFPVVGHDVSFNSALWDSVLRSIGTLKRFTHFGCVLYWDHLRQHYDSEDLLFKTLGHQLPFRYIARYLVRYSYSGCGRMDYLVCHSYYTAKSKRRWESLRPRWIRLLKLYYEIRTFSKPASRWSLVGCQVLTVWGKLNNSINLYMFQYG